MSKKEPISNIGKSSLFVNNVSLTLKDAKIHRDMNKDLELYVDESLEVAAKYEANQESMRKKAANKICSIYSQIKMLSQKAHPVHQVDDSI